MTLEKELKMSLKPNIGGLSEGELGNLLASVGNHEVKALVLGVMNPEEIYSGGALRKILLESQNGLTGWDFDNRLPTHYLKESLEPIGLVAAEVVDTQHNRYGFVKTQYGEYVGDALAGFLLDFSLGDQDISLIDYFGSTASSAISGDELNDQKKRSPLTRYRIFWELITRPLPAREIGGLGNTREELQSWVEEAVANMGPSTTKAIQEYLEMYHSKKVIPTTINRIMMELIQAQRMIISSAGTSYVYAPSKISE